MKKTLYLVILLLSLLLLPSCNKEEVVSEPESQVFFYSYANGHQQLIIDDPIEWVDQYDSYKSETAPKTHTITFLDSLYEVAYYSTNEYEESDIIAHLYRCNEPRISVKIDATTNEWIYITRVPYEHSAKTEEEYLEECMKILGTDSSKAKTFQQSSETSFYQYDASGNKKNCIRQGFYMPCENEVLTEREFLFEKYIDGVKTNEQYRIWFDEQNHTIYVQRYIFGYTSSTFERRKEIDMNSLVDEYLLAHKNPDKELGAYRLEETMFVKNGIPYSRVFVYFECGDIVWLIVKH